MANHCFKSVVMFVREYWFKKMCPTKVTIKSSNSYSENIGFCHFWPVFLLFLTSFMMKSFAGTVGVQSLRLGFEISTAGGFRPQCKHLQVFILFIYNLRDNAVEFSRLGTSNLSKDNDRKLLCTLNTIGNDSEKIGLD